MAKIEREVGVKAPVEAMASTVLIAEDDAASRRLYREMLDSEGYHVVAAEDGLAALNVLKTEHVDLLVTDVQMPGLSGFELLEQSRELNPDLRAIIMAVEDSPDTLLDALKNRACDFLYKPFSAEELQGAVRACLERPPDCQLEVISAKPDWIEIRVPCHFSAVEPIQRFLTEVPSHLPKEIRDAIGAVFREMLNNAIEHGGKCDITNRVIVKYIRLKRAILYSIKDPGEGFNLEEIEHAAVANPEDQPMRHMEVRKEKGLRPGGFGILFASQIIDELIYNEKHNELMFVKYLDTPED